VSKVEIIAEETLSDDYAKLTRTRFALRRRDGDRQVLTRETYHRQDAAALLLYDPARGTVLLTRQFRYPAFVNGGEEALIEVCAGLLDGDDPAVAIMREAAEECGVEVADPTRLFDAYMAPGALTEKIVFFAAPYSPAMRVAAGGGLAAEGEDIEVIELPFAEALAMCRDGRIRDAKSILLLQHAALSGLISLA